MTDNDITKALECCANEDASCPECPLGRDYDCRLQIASYALETINRQQDEIERLKAKSAKWTEHKDEKHTCIAGKSEEQRLLHLVNKLTEEVDRLKAIESTEEKAHQYCKDVCYPMHEEEIAMLTEEKDNLIRTYKECQVAILVDFAEKLMGVYTDKFGSTKESLVSYIVQKEIKKLVKEMTEGKG